MDDEMKEQHKKILSKTHDVIYEIRTVCEIVIGRDEVKSNPLVIADLLHVYVHFLKKEEAINE